MHGAALVSVTRNLATMPPVQQYGCYRKWPLKISIFLAEMEAPLSRTV